MSGLKHYWLGLQPRERRTLMLGGMALLCLLIYTLVVDPFQRELSRLESSVASQRELLGWMEQAASQVKQLQGSGGNAGRSGSQSLLSLIDTSAKSNGLGAALKQVKPEGQGVRVRLEEAPFDDIVRWFDQLGQTHGVAVNTLTLERLSTPGRVNLTVVLERGA